MAEMPDMFGLPDEPLPLDEAELRHAWPQSLVDMLDVVAAAHARKGVDPAQARDYAFTALAALAEYHGGRMWYLPFGDGLALALRNKRIWHAFRGDNVHELSREYDLSEMAIYKILAEQRALHRRRVQPDLFPSAE